MDKLFLKGISTRPGTHAVHMLQFYKEKYNILPQHFFNAYAGAYFGKKKRKKKVKRKRKVKKKVKRKRKK